MATRRLALAFVVALLPGLVFAGIPEAVTYVELPLGGPHVDDGRTLPTSSGEASYGIDILSELDIRIDPDALRAALLRLVQDQELDLDAAALLERIEHLTNATTVIRDKTEAAQTTFESGNWDESRMAIAEMGSTLGRLFRELTACIEVRLEQDGVEDARAAAMQDLEPVFRVTTYPGYDFEVLESLFSRELERLYEDLRQYDPGFKIEIQGHLIDKRGHAFAVYLPGYNTVETGPLKPSSKLRFEMSEDEQKLYEKYEELAKELGPATSVARALMMQLEAEFELVRPELDEFAAGVNRAVARTEASIDELLSWKGSERWEAWGDAVALDLQDELGDSYDALLQVIEEVETDHEALLRYTDLDTLLAGKNADEAMSTILSLFGRDGAEVGVRSLRADTWRSRAETVSTFIDDVQALAPTMRDRIVNSPSGPWATVQGARDSIRELTREIAAVAPQTLDWVRKTLGIPVVSIAANLPVPPGQKQQQLDDASTGFALRTIKRETEEGDRIRVGYRFFFGEEPIEGAGWFDEFYLAEFGWSSNVMASLAFTRRDGGPDNSWEPAPAVNWIVHRRRWAKSGKRGMRGTTGMHKFGFGLSTMTLDFDDANDIEIGLAASIAAIDDRIIVGYGTNLQANTNDEFFFFSIRLLNLASVP